MLFVNLNLDICVMERSELGLICEPIKEDSVINL